MSDWPQPKGTYINLATEYGVSSSASATANAAAIQRALVDAGPGGARQGQTLYQQADAPIPCNQVVLPNYPIHWVGDTPSTSLYQAPAGYNLPQLTYDPTLGVSDTGIWGEGSGSVAGTPFRGMAWVLENLGWTTIDGGASGNKGWSFPTWSGPDPNHRLTLWARSCSISNQWGTGVEYLINGCVNDSFLENIIVFNTEGRGFEVGSDLRCVNCVSANNGYEGFYINARNTQLDACKSWSNGTLTHSRGVGLYITGEGEGVVATNFDTQDNYAYGVQIQAAGKVSIIGLKIARDCADASFSSGILIADSHDVQIIGGICTDSSGWTRTNPTGNMLHSIKVTNTGGVTNYNNYVQLVQSVTQGSDGNTATMGVPVDPTSNLSGTIVIFGDGFVAATDSSPISTQYVQPGASVTVNRKLVITDSATGAPVWSRAGLSLGLGSIYRIL